MSELPREVRVHAPAKVNLGLEVLGRRDDGFHELATSILALELGDELVVRRGGAEGGISLEVDGPQGGPEVPRDPQNLAWRAAAVVREHAVDEGNELALRSLELRLTKRIPVGAGLGGGSADAAAAMLGVSEVLGVALDDARAAAMLAPLGSDCPFFHVARASGLARCTGRGEIVRPVSGDPFPWWVVVITPEIACATAKVYAALEPHRIPSPQPRFSLERVLHGELDDVRCELVNDLETAALASHPELACWFEVLDRPATGHFRLSGSGSSCFGLFATEAEARAVVDAITVRGKARDLGLRGAWVSRAAGRGIFVAERK